MAVRERWQWIFQERLCYRRFSLNRITSACKESIKCIICGSERQPDLFHLSREDKKGKSPKEREQPLRVEITEKSENVNPKCTSIYKGSSGGLSCSKIVLVDIYNEDRPDDVNRVYAIVDDQSSASLITPDLADKLNAKGPEWKYYFSTCGGEREARYGHRVTGDFLKSVHGRTSRLHTLSECDGVPQDKEEILNLKIAIQYPHLSIIAEEIPPLGSEARVQLLIGRDASEFLKVRCSRTVQRDLHGLGNLC